MRTPFLIVTAVVALGAGFVWQTGSDLPPVVASHFTLAGRADGHSPRAAYLGLMLALVVVVPLGAVASGWLVGRLPARFVNLPRRDYWLAPERLSATVSSLCNWLAVLASGLVGLLCLAHWQVIQANAEAAVGTMPSSGLGVGLALFLGASLLWVLALYRRFARVP